MPEWTKERTGSCPSNRPRGKRFAAYIKAQFNELALPRPRPSRWPGKPSLCRPPNNAPFWVTSALPLERTSVLVQATSALCQKRTSIGLGVDARYADAAALPKAMP